MAEVPGVDALYDVPAEDFVAARDALSKALRSAGERDAAALVKQLRRPTRAAWALNQLARRHTDDVRTLVELGRALADAQEQALAGRDVDLRQAGRARMDVLRHLTRLAEGILGPGAAAQRDEVVATLTAASADPASGAQLVAGRLAEPLGAPAGFGDPLAGWGLAGSAATPAPGSPRTRTAATGRKGSTDATPPAEDPVAEPAPAGRGGTRRTRSTGATPPPDDQATGSGRAVDRRTPSRDAAPPPDDRATAPGRVASRRKAPAGALPPPIDLGAAREAAAVRAGEARRQADAERAEARAREAAERADVARAAVASAAAALATSAAAADAAADRVAAVEAELDAARAEAAAARAALEADTSALDAARREAADADRAARDAADAVAGHTGDRPG